jgi:hypothetical protein
LAPNKAAIREMLNITCYRFLFVKDLKEKKTKMLKHKITIATALFAVLTIVTTSIVFLPVGNATSTEQTWTFLLITPNPIGVGQQVTVSMWIYPLPPNANLRYDDLSVTVTKPDGTTETFGPATGGPLGNYVWNFVPSATGTYYFVAHFPGCTFSDVPPPYVPAGDVVRLASDSSEVALTVQQEPIERLPDTPLPTEYWTYPINAQNYLWSSISGSWLGSGRGYNNTGPVNPYSTGPKTAHVLWKKQAAFGGIEGGIFEANSYHGGTGYQEKNPVNVIINGRTYLYSSEGDAGWGNRKIGNWLDCIDLATGEVMWTKEISVSFGQIYEYHSTNQMGLHAWLWSQSGSTWSMYDAFNGNWILDLVNVTVPRGTSTATAMDNVGSCGGSTGRGAILYYMINLRQGWLALWNQTKCFDETGVISYQSQAQKDQFGVYGGMLMGFGFSPGRSYDWMKGIEWNVTIPQEPVDSQTFTLSGPYGVGVVDSGFRASNFVSVYGYNLEPGNVRKLYGPVNFTGALLTNFPVGSGLFGRFDQANMQHVFWDLYTGEFAMKQEPMTSPWGTIPVAPFFAYDRFYTGAYDGIHCCDTKTGEELWYFTPGSAGLETPFGTWVAHLGSTRIAGDRLYSSTGVWHALSPYSRGDKLYCLDPLTGKMLWNYTGYWQVGPVANGYLLGFNEYDQSYNCLSKGPSATTVSASPKVAESGSAVLIEGMVTDESPATQESTLKAKFPNGVPAIADKDMTQWMEYVYQQQPKPMTAIGVPVMLMAMCSDGSIIDIATVYSDINGHYEYLWTPPTQDTYKILASFIGSDAYWSSSAETAVGVTAAHPSNGIEPEPTEPEPTGGITTEIAIIAAVAVVAVIAIVAYWALRKRK